ncbi:MAG: hypothetical protein EPO07_02320 [Verrucomicrobia bacterium]|nr:MAG: hypothetical protein EPO07_02320 [Verrucomicrobiota bacterium]
MNLSITDISKLTPDEASQLFNQAVDETQRGAGIGYKQAFERAKSLYKDLWARVIEGNRPVTYETRAASLALGNDGIPPEPVFAPPMLTLLGLPADADTLEERTAWRATKGVTTPRDSAAIKQALFDLWRGRLAAQKSGRVTDAEVELKMKERFPLLYPVASTVSN